MRSCHATHRGGRRLCLRWRRFVRALCKDAAPARSSAYAFLPTPHRLAGEKTSVCRQVSGLPNCVPRCMLRQLFVRVHRITKRTGLRSALLRSSADRRDESQRWAMCSASRTVAKQMLKEHMALQRAMLAFATRVQELGTFFARHSVQKKLCTISPWTSTRAVGGRLLSQSLGASRGDSASGTQ